MHSPFIHLFIHSFIHPSIQEEIQIMVSSCHVIQHAPPLAALAGSNSNKSSTRRTTHILSLTAKTYLVLCMHAYTVRESMYLCLSVVPPTYHHSWPSLSMCSYWPPDAHPPSVHRLLAFRCSRWDGRRLLARSSVGNSTAAAACVVSERASEVSDWNCPAGPRGTATARHSLL